MDTFNPVIDIKERIIAKAAVRGKELAAGEEVAINFIEERVDRHTFNGVFPISEGFVGGDAFYDAIDELIAYGVHRNGVRKVSSRNITEYYAGTLLRRPNGDTLWLDLSADAVEIEDERHSDAEYDAMHNDSLMIRG